MTTRSCRALCHAVWLTVVVAMAPAGGAREIELQGHRGARGLMPENTVVGFQHALSIGVHTLELDLVMSADGTLVVSHDPVLNPAIVRDAHGRWLSAPGPSVLSLTHSELARFDVGRIDPNSKYATRFPEQRAVDGTRMPSLNDVLSLIERDDAAHVRLNVETKLRPDRPTVSPTPKRFADVLAGLILARNVTSRVSVQSFDWRTLAHVQAIAPEIETVCLTVEQRWLDNLERGKPGPSPWTAGHDIDAHGGSVARLVKAGGCRVWSPYFREVTADAVSEAHRLGLRVVVWTVNERADLDAAIALGVDGIITDYPDRARRALRARGISLPPAIAPRHRR